MRDVSISHKFVQSIPANLEDDVLYVCIEYATAVHKCCCGCGEKVVTPITPTDWQITFNGASVSLSPSIGNWSFACKSHYWILKNAVRWSDSWSDEQIELGRSQDLSAKNRYYANDRRDSVDLSTIPPKSKTIISKILKWWRQ